MYSNADSKCRWSTSSFGEATDPTAGDLISLGEHLGLCRASLGRMFLLRCAAESVHGFVVPRFVTSLVMALLISVAFIAIIF